MSQSKKKLISKKKASGTKKPPAAKYQRKIKVNATFEQMIQKSIQKTR